MGRKQDRQNVGFAFNGISDFYRQYLAKGGYGFIIGDGKLPNYGLETIFEINYNVKVSNFLSVTPDYQLVINTQTEVQFMLSPCVCTRSFKKSLMS